MFRRLTRLQRFTLVLFVIMVTNWVMVSTTGYTLLGGDLFTVFFLIFLVLTGVALGGALVRKVRYNKTDGSMDQHPQSEHAKQGCKR